MRREAPYAAAQGDWRTSPAARYAIEIDPSCTACGACIATCPCRALTPAPFRPVLVPDLCNGCLDCVEIRPRGALSARADCAIARRIPVAGLLEAAGL